MDAKAINKRIFSHRIAGIFVIFLVLLCLSIIVHSIWSRTNTVNEAEKFAEKLSVIQSDNIELSLSSANMILQGVAEQQYFNSLFGYSENEELENSLKGWVQQTPQISWILISDQNGKVKLIASKGAHKEWATAKNDLKADDFFKHHKLAKTKQLQKELFIQIGDKADKANQTQLILSRSIYNFDGSFAGVIATAIDTKAFFNFFESIERKDGISLGIIVNNQFLALSNEQDYKSEWLYNFSRTSDVKGKVDKLSGKPIILNQESEYGNYIVSFARLPHLPVVVATIFNKDEILSNWWTDRWTDLLFLVLFVTFGTILFLLVQDMSKQILRAEDSEKQALLANQAKSEFLAKMSHELRTPLNAIIGFSEMIDSGYFGPVTNRKQQERIHDINLCGNHLLNLINDILDYTKGEAGKLELRESEFPVKRVFDNSVRIIEDRAKRKGIEIINNIEDESVVINADEMKIKQIAINLLSNAVKFTKKNGQITISADIDKDGNAELSVSDTGIGMAQEDIPVALSVFGQVKHRHDVDEEGTGLGLPLCKMFTELHGGRFSIESKINVGTKVIVKIPVERVTFKAVGKKKAVND